MRCGAGVFAATRLLRRLLMPSYQFASEKPVCGVCGDDKDSDLLPLPGGLRWREKPKTALTAARGFCKLRKSWSKVRFRSETKPARRRSAPAPENQIPIPCRRHPRRCRHRHGPRTPASWCRCRATPRPSSGGLGPVTVDRESRWRGSGSARGCSLLTPEGVGSTNAALSIEPSLRRPIRSKTSAAHTGTVGRNGLTQRISLLAVCRGRKREIG